MPEPEQALLDDRNRALCLFPNAMPVTGLKHVSDNLLGSILQGLPQSLASQLSSRVKSFQSAFEYD